MGALTRGALTMGALTMTRAGLASLILAAAVGSTLPAAAAEAFFPRQPTISPDGATVVFGCEGDLWSVSSDGGVARRLTAHPAYDREPVFSPDGASVCFASDREGDVDLYVMPAAGGLPRRLTFAPAEDLPQDWSADGSTILFTSRRPWRYPMKRQVLAIPAAGGTELRFADLFAEEIAVSPDGASYLLSVGDQTFGRVGYRGTLQSDLWLWRPGSDPVRLTDHPGYDTDPMWGPRGESVYWRAEDDETGAFNVWHMAPDGAGKTRLTDFRDGGVRCARISRNGARMVFEAGSSLWILDTTAGAQPRQLAITLASDANENPVVVKDLAKDAAELSVDAAGQELALVVQGEIVLVNQELEGRATVPLPSPWRESGVAFRPGTADTLVFVSDREIDDGEHYSRLGLLIADDPDTTLLRAARHWRTTWLTPEGVEAAAPAWSPDGKRLAYRHGAGKLAVMDADGKNRRILVDGWDDPDFAWSPDSRWLAYAVATGEDFNRDIWLREVDGGDAVNVSQHPDYDEGPVWNQDGTILAWSSRRYANQYDVVFCYLRRADHERTREEWKVWEKVRDKSDPKGKQEGKNDGKDDAKDGDKNDDKKKAKTPPPPPPIRVDLEDIHLRVIRATSGPGDEFVVAVHPRGDRLVFTADAGSARDLFTVDRFGEDRKALTTGGQKPAAARLGADGKTVWFLADGRPARVPLEGGEVKTTSFRARLTTDEPARRLQVLEEGWRRLRDGFYDAGMHGVDWDAQLAKGRELVAGCRHDGDFADAMNLTLRTLNASHMGYYPPAGEVKAAFLGVHLDPAWRGEGLRVAAVVPHGPADREGGRLQTGDVIVAVNDVPVGRDSNLYAPIVAAGGDPVRITAQRDGRPVEVVVVPATFNDLRQRIYDEDITANRRRADELGEGRVGYVHIQGMGQREVEFFERDLYAAAAGKEALVIDVRDNGGGWTTDLLLTILTQPVHAYTVPRGGTVGYPDAERLPLQRWNKPIAVLCNEGSYSNAEIFSHAIKTIGRGPVVGTTTGGNVISTDGWTALDGAHIRLPFRGWYVWGDARDPGRNGLNQEHGGCIPDHVVPLGPPQVLRGEDPQLAAAVALMLEAATAARAAPRPELR
jgi:tricorn protease